MLSPYIYVGVFKGMPIILSLYLIPWTLIAITKWFKFFFFMLKLILISQERLPIKISLFRSLWRKIGLFQYFHQKKFRGHFILIDEGIFHFSHNILMSKLYCANQETISKFINLVPRREFIFCLSANYDMIYKRLLARGNLTNRIQNDNDLKIFLSNAIFDHIARHNLKHGGCLNTGICILINSISKQF